jgi:hypothetical protein
LTKFIAVKTTRHWPTLTTNLKAYGISL